MSAERFIQPASLFPCRPGPARRRSRRRCTGRGAALQRAGYGAHGACLRSRAVSPDGKRVAYTQRTTDMEANKGRTSIWLLDTGKARRAPARLTDLAANSMPREWSTDGRIHLFSVESQRPARSAGVAASVAPAPAHAAPTRRRSPICRSMSAAFRVSPKGDRIVVSRRGVFGLRGSGLHQAAPGCDRAFRGHRRSVQPAVRQALGHLERWPALAALCDDARRCGVAPARP